MNISTAEQQAQKQFAQGRLQESAKALEDLYRHFPERLDLQAQLGYLALLANDLDTAISRLSQAINDGLRTRKVLAHLAEAYYRGGRLESAAYCYQRLGRDGLAGTLAVMAKFDAYQLTSASRSAELPWVTDHPLPVIPACLNGRHAHLVIDTGAGDTVLDMAFAVDAQVRLGGQEHRTFAGGMPALVTYGHADALQLGDIDMQNVPVQVIDMPAGLSAWFPHLPIHGILGSGVFSRFRTTLDYRNAQLRLQAQSEHEDSAPPVRQAKPAGTPLWLAENQLLLTRVDVPALDQGVWFLDSGMTGGAFAVAESKVETLGLQLDKSDALLGTGGGGTVQGHKVRMQWLRLDRLCRHAPHGVVLNSFPLEQCCGFSIHGLIGHDMLRGASLTLDFPLMRLFVNTSDG